MDENGATSEARAPQLVAGETIISMQNIFFYL